MSGENEPALPSLDAGSFDAFSAAYDQLVTPESPSGGERAKPATPASATSQQTRASTQSQVDDEGDFDDLEVNVADDGTVSFVTPPTDDDTDEGQGDDAAADGTDPLVARIGNLRAEFTRKQQRMQAQHASELQALRGELSQAGAYIQGLVSQIRGAPAQQAQQPPEEDPFKGLDPNDPYDRLTIAEKKALMAAQKADSWLEKQQQQVAQAQQAQQGAQQKAALVQWQESTVTNFVEAYAKQAGLTSKEAKYHAWNAGFAAMMSSGGGRESVQAVNAAVAQAIRSLKTTAVPARQTPAVPASTSAPTRSTVSAPNSNAPRKSVREMNKSEFDTGVLDWLDRNT